MLSNTFALTTVNMINSTTTWTPTPQDRDACPCCGASGFQGSCHACGYGTSHPSHPPLFPAPQDGSCPSCGTSGYRACHSCGHGSYKFGHWAPPAPQDENCPYCGASGYTGSCHACDYNTSNSKPALTSLGMNMVAGYLPPVPQDADTCPRCGASGFQGQCHSCGYNTGIGT